MSEEAAEADGPADSVEDAERKRRYAAWRRRSVEVTSRMVSLAPDT